MTLPDGRAASRLDKVIVCAQLLRAWLRCPELRLGQLVINATAAHRVPLALLEDRRLGDLVAAFGQGRREGGGL